MSDGLANVLKIVGFILYPYLGFNDLLRLRRLCKWSKALAEDYLRLKASTERCIELSLNPEEPNNLSSFLNLSLTVPLCHVSIKNERDGIQIWDMEEHVSKFLALYGQKITHLTLRNLELPMGSEALAFFESLPYLEHLEIAVVYTSTQTKFKEEEINGLVFPSTFRKLKKLDIGIYFWSPSESNSVKQYKRQIFIKLLQWCQPCLESFKRVNRFPYSAYRTAGADHFEPMRTTLIQVENPKLKIYDLRSITLRNNTAAGMEFYRVLKACYKMNIKLYKVHAELIEQMLQRDTAALENLKEKLSHVIMSIYSVRKSCFHLELPNLEALEVIDEYSLSYPADEFERKPWSNLKRLRIQMDRRETLMSQLLNYFFVGIRREKMEQLALEFFEPLSAIIHFNALDIGRSCPNLKELRLRGWRGNNLRISKLWELLPLLEVLEFGRCNGLTIEAFIGETREEPSFLKLKNLHRLTLGNLDHMPMITDDLFVTVLRHMPLKELYLLACSIYIPQITAAGIRSLNTGVFAQTIERFPLTGKLKLVNVSEKQLSLLEKEFRSYNML